MLNTTDANKVETPKTSGGFVVGQAATDKVGFYGTTPIIQPTSSDQAAVATTAATNSSPYGYSQTQADAIVTLLNEIRTVLVDLGLMKGS